MSETHAPSDDPSVSDPQPMSEPHAPLDDPPVNLPDPCIICMEPMLKSTVQFTPCIHGFHKQCIAEWLKTKYDEATIPCPMCKLDISPLLYELDDLIKTNLHDQYSSRDSPDNPILTFLMHIDQAMRMARPADIVQPVNLQMPQPPNLQMPQPVNLQMPFITQPMEHILNNMLAMDGRPAMFDFPIEPMLIFQQQPVQDSAQDDQPEPEPESAPQPDPPSRNTRSIIRARRRLNQPD